VAKWGNGACPETRRIAKPAGGARRRRRKRNKKGKIYNKQQRIRKKENLKGNTRLHTDGCQARRVGTGEKKKNRTKNRGKAFKPKKGEARE